LGGHGGDITVLRYGLVRRPGRRRRRRRKFDYRGTVTQGACGKTAMAGRF